MTNGIFLSNKDADFIAKFMRLKIEDVDSNLEELKKEQDSSITDKTSLKELKYRLANFVLEEKLELEKKAYIHIIDLVICGSSD